MATQNKIIKLAPVTTSVELKSIDVLIQKRAQLCKMLKPMGLADAAIYHYSKQGGFFSKKQQHLQFTFFQGLNTNPQNLSIFLRDMVTNLSKSQNSASKQKLTKGQFIVYDMFNENDCVIEISIPGNFQIYKLKANKKQLISNNQIDSMYVSSVLRAMYGKCIVWGKVYSLFGTKSVIDEYKQFLGVFVKVVQKHDLTISQDYELKCSIKGSHACSILFSYIKQKRICNHTIEYLEKYFTSIGGYEKGLPKLLVLLCELYSLQNKYAKSLNIIGSLLTRFQNDPYILYYQAKYMLKLMTVHESLLIINSIVQYNQFQIWTLTAQIHTQLKNYTQALFCLNHASKIASKAAKTNIKSVQPENIYFEFQKLGKRNMVGTFDDDITQRPKLMIAASENPTSITSLVQEKYRPIVESQYWKLGHGQKIVYQLLRVIRYRLDTKKFQELLEHTFEQSKKQFPVINFKTGLSESMFIQAKNQIQNLKGFGDNHKEEEELPNFLKDQSIEIEAQEQIKGNRNLSIIPQLQSVIQNSQFEEKQKQAHKLKPAKLKKELSEQFFKIIKLSLSETEIEKAEFEQNWAKVLPVYNKLRTSGKLNNFYTDRMFEIMLKIENYRSVLVLIAQSLDSYEQMGLRKIQVLPLWMQGFIFEIIEEKGLKFLNGLLQKMQFFDEAVIDTIELAKNWKIKGCTF